MLNKNIIALSIISILFFNKVFSEEIPTIVIAPSKQPQSISTVGTSVVVLDEKYFKNTKEFFLGDVLAGSSTSSNFFQSGGYGATSAVQLRGLPKRYSTVYIDGVKMSDPSSVSGDFDFNHILTSQISRVEILKGNQSSVYGSGAIGGTINITTKKGEPGLHKDISYTTGSHGTNNLFASLSGADDNDNFYIGFERFETDGISQMMHNEEKDRYRNNTLVLNYAHEFTDNLKLESNSRIADTYLQYDKEVDTATATHNEEEDGIQSSSNLSLIYKLNEKFNNKFTLGKTYIKRIYASHAQVVCLALSLFLLHMHDVVIICNMRNAESCSLRLGATSWVCRTRQCTGVANGALQTQPGSCLVMQKAQKKGAKKKKASLRPSPSTAIILGVHRRP